VPCAHDGEGIAATACCTSVGDCTQILAQGMSRPSRVAKAHKEITSVVHIMHVCRAITAGASSVSVHVR